MKLYSLAALAIMVSAATPNLFCMLECAPEAERSSTDSNPAGEISTMPDAGAENDAPAGGSLKPPLPAEMPNDRTAGQGELLCMRGGKKLVMPLVNTAVVGDVSGFLARVSVTQKFISTLDTAMEAVYTFPLPENGAVDSMTMTVGCRRIQGVIRKRAEAREMYEQARREGKTASLLEQERPNIFTQSVANILPGDTILVAISYVQELSYRDGTYRFNFPMVVGPRYIPGTPIGSENRGTEAPTNRVPDAHRVTPPLLSPQMRCGNDITLCLTIGNCTVSELASPSHKIRIRPNGSGGTEVRLMPNDGIPNKDFMLEYAVARNEIRPLVLTHKHGDDGFLQMIMVPQCSVAAASVFPRELVFVVDNSGSMMGEPIEKCREVMRRCLATMRPDDLFRVIKFAGTTEIMSERPLPATKDNVAKALAFVDNMRSGGGTEMLRAIHAIFDAPEITARKRLVLFMTDGYIGNEKEILSTIRQRLGGARVFSLGIGSSVNRYLLEGMGYAGRGLCTIIRQDGDAEKAIKEFYARIDAPVLTDITVSTRGITLYEQQPARLPDLFSGCPLVLTAKYGKPGRGSLTISGKLPRGKKYEKTVEVTLPASQPENGVLPTLWARRKIAEIDLRGSGYFDDDLVAPAIAESLVTSLGLQYRIMTQYTSFVAVDAALRNKSGKWVSVEQPVPLPEGTLPNGQPAHRFVSGGSACRTSMSKGALGAISGRKGVAGIGYGAGYGSGFGGSGSSGVDALMGGVGGLKKGGGISIQAPEFSRGGRLTGGRSKASVMRVIMQNLASLRYAYNKRLREKPELQGKITVKFAIDEFGKVIFCQMVESTLNDPGLERSIVDKIKLWAFEKIDKPGDVTEVVYPFVFSR